MPKKKRVSRTKSIQAKPEPSPEPTPKPRSSVPKSWPYQEMTKELYDFLHAERPVTWGDALRIIHDWESKDRHDLVELATGAISRSEFMTDLLWHISFYDGPKGEIPYPDKE